MIARLILFVAVAGYLAFNGEWVLAALALTGLIPGLLGLLGAVVLVVGLFVTGHYALGVVVAFVVAAVFSLSNPQLAARLRRQR